MIDPRRGDRDVSSQAADLAPATREGEGEGEAPRAPRDVTKRAMGLTLTGVIAVAFLGYFVGLDYGVPRHDFGPPAPVPAAGGVSPDLHGSPREVLPAMSYADMRERRIGPTRKRRVSLEPWKVPAPEPDVTIEIDLEARRASLATRAERRAYNGAPPVIPHAVDAFDHDACLACHSEGLRVESLTARPLPHPYLRNCMQCHAPPGSDALASVDDRSSVAAPENSFDGIAAPFQGERAWPGAPPTVPHSTWMRDNCLACHGPGGWPGMETTHPWRRMCLQCHAPSAALDQRVAGRAESPFLPPPRLSSRR